MKILHIETRFHPSYGYQVQQMARLHDKAHEVVVVTSKSLGNLRNRDMADDISILDERYERETGIRIIRLNAWFEVREKIALKGLVDTIEGEQPDVIFAHGVEYLALMQLILSGVAGRYPLLTDSHDLPTAGRSEFLRGLFRIPHRWITVRFLNNHRIRTYYVQPQSKEMLRRSGVREEIMHYLPLGVDEDVFHPDPQARAEMRAKFGIQHDEVVILYTGKRDSQKDPALILEAMSLLSADLLARIKVFMVGAEDPAYRDERISPLLAATPAQDRVFFLDPVPFKQLAGFYAMADLGVFPRQNTMSALDAMASGLPLIMQDDHTNRERLKHGGLVYAAGNAGDLMRKLSELMVDPELRGRLSDGGPQYVKDNHSYRTTVNMLENDMRFEIERHKISCSPSS